MNVRYSKPSTGASEFFKIDLGLQKDDTRTSDDFFSVTLEREQIQMFLDQLDEHNMITIHFPLAGKI